MSQYQNRKAILTLKAKRERSVLRWHPWIFSGAVAGLSGEAEPGETVEVRGAGGEFLAWASYNPHSQIVARIWSWDPQEAIDEAFFQRRLVQAFTARRNFSEEASAMRLVHAESDGLPGLIVDRYADILVVQFLTAGAERWREPIVDLCMALSGARCVYDRSDVDVRRLEGLPARVGLLRGEEPPARLVIHELASRGELRFAVDVRQGHKTAFYLDQRDNRRRVGQLAQGRDVLDCFCYSGGFALHAAEGGATTVLGVDTSREALFDAAENAALNHLHEPIEWLEGDVFAVLRSFRDARRSFDLIVLDPPKFAQTASQVERASRGYKDINLLAFKLLRPGGLLITFSCSGGVSEELFQKIVAGAAQDAGVRALILERLHQAPDHPVALNFPEGAYLKGFMIRVA